MTYHTEIPSNATQYADAVLEGGGMRAIAHVGALAAAEARGYHWQHCAGTSAGAMVAALLTAGYTAIEMRELLGTVDFAQLVQDRGLRGCPGVQLGRLLWHGGLHTGSALETFVRDLLRARENACSVI